MLQRQRPYIVIGKVSLLVYKLDIPVHTKIHPVIFVVYLSRYRIYEDLYHCVLLSFGSVECGSDSETSVNEARDGQHWKLERIVDYRMKRDRSVKYLMR